MQAQAQEDAFKKLLTKDQPKGTEQFVNKLPAHICVTNLLIPTTSLFHAQFRSKMPVVLGQLLSKCDYIEAAHDEAHKQQNEFIFQLLCGVEYFAFARKIQIRCVGRMYRSQIRARRSFADTFKRRFKNSASN